MSKFHFEKDMGDNVLKVLSELDYSLQETVKSINNRIAQIRSFQGFGISEIISSLYSEVSEAEQLGLKTESGAEVLRFIINSANNHAKTASAITSAAVNAGAEAINNVINSAQNTQENKEISFEKAKHGDVFEQDGFTYQMFSYWDRRRVLRTDGAGGIGIFKADGTAYDGYSQGQPWWWNNTPNKAYVDPSYECTSAALATSSTINGIDKIPDDYNDWGGNTQIGGYPCSSEELTKFCLDNLYRGLTTVIYYNYSGFNGFGHDGHAVTVVGADPNPTSVYDLWVIDPVDGQCKSFREAFGNKSDNFYICYESNPDEYGGAGVKLWDIEQYFGSK